MQTKSILLVDDNENDIILAQTAFNRRSFRSPLTVLQDGQEALDYLFNAGKFAQPTPASLPAFMLVDLNMPRIDGFDVIRAVRADPRTELLPIVVLTSSMEPRDIIKCYHLGANSYVRKPVEFDEFVELAERLSVYWLTINELPLAPS